MSTVGAISAKERLIRNVVRLRRAERASQVHEDIAAVRADLERNIGATVGRAMAARLLGVSQTALDRWTASGDVPVVITRTGRREVPRHALLGLVEAVEERRRSGESRNPLAAVLRGQRADAEGVDIEIDQRARRRRALRHGHRDAELRGLAYHRAVAGRLDEVEMLPVGCRESMGISDQRWRTSRAKSISWLARRSAPAWSCPDTLRKL